MIPQIITFLPLRTQVDLEKKVTGKYDTNIIIQIKYKFYASIVHFFYTQTN